MASVTRSCGTGANVSAGMGMGTDWSNAGNITASDNSYATQDHQVGMAMSVGKLKATNFGFSIDSGATIDGIIVTIERKSNNANNIEDVDINILNGDGSGGVGSTDKSTGAAWPTTEAEATFGGASEKWGETWTPAKINSSNFGVQIECDGQNGGMFTTNTASVDHIEITVHYTLASSDPDIKFGSAQVTKVYLGSQLLSKIEFGEVDIDL